MGRTVTPNQLVAGFAWLLAVCFASTFIVWRWPNSSYWVLGGVVASAVLYVFLVYRAERKATRPPD